MPTLESLSIWKRLVLALVVVAVIVLILFGLSLTLDEAPGQPAPLAPTPPLTIYQGVPLDAALLRLDKRALDEAYHEQLLKLWGVWLASGAPDEAKNFINGLRIARRAYTQAAAQIARRETELLEQERTRQQSEPIQQPK